MTPPGGRGAPSPRSSSLRRVALAVVALVGLAPVASCVKRGYPLGANGSVDIRRNQKSSLFVSPAFDDKGRPVGPRQYPYYTDVTLFMSEDSEPAKGAFVDVRVDPPEALELTVAGNDVESGTKTCERMEGIFRCTATDEGVAHFRATANSDWSSVTDEATIHVEWAGADSNNSTENVRVLPAGLPATAASSSATRRQPRAKRGASATDGAATGERGPYGRSLNGSRLGHAARAPRR